MKTIPIRDSAIRNASCMFHKYDKHKTFVLANTFQPSHKLIGRQCLQQSSLIPNYRNSKRLVENVQRCPAQPMYPCFALAMPKPKRTYQYISISLDHLPTRASPGVGVVLDQVCGLLIWPRVGYGPDCDQCSRPQASLRSRRL